MSKVLKCVQVSIRASAGTGPLTSEQQNVQKVTNVQVTILHP